MQEKERLASETPNLWLEIEKIKLHNVFLEREERVHALDATIEDNLEPYKIESETLQEKVTELNRSIKEANENMAAMKESHRSAFIDKDTVIDEYKEKFKDSKMQVTE